MRSHPPLFVLHPDAALQASARLARPRAVACAGWSELRHALSAAPPTAQALVDPWDADGRPAEELRALLASLPSASVVAALEMQPSRMGHVLTLQQWGVVEVAALPAEAAPRALAHILVRAQGRAFLRAMRNALPAHLSGRSTAMLLVAAQAAHAGGGPPALGSALGQGPASLAHACAAEGLPGPVRLMRWMRAFVLAQLLDDPARTPESVAQGCGYASVERMGAALARVLPGADAAGLRAAGAFAQVARAFRAETFALREEARDRRRALRTGARKPGWRERRNGGGT